MSAQAKAARAAMKDKAKRLASESSSKVDASDYRIPTDMHAEAKTGMRPVSKKAYKRGGAVSGEKPAERADRRPRASGGTALANALVNRNDKDANQERDGVKHTGGLARGGKAKRTMGSVEARQFFDRMAEREMQNRSSKAEAFLRTPEGEAKRQADNAAMVARLKARESGNDDGLKRGGRAYKADGGDAGQMIDPRKVAEIRMKAASDRAGVAPNRFAFTGVKPGMMASAAGLKKGGEVEGSAKDKREDKAMARARGMTMAEWERSAADKKHDRPKRASGGKADDQFPPERGDDRPPMPARDGADSSRNSPSRPVIDLSNKLGKYAKGGAAHAKDCKCAACSGGRMARASGGRTKSGKTNVNIVIATGQPRQGAGDMPPPSMAARPPAMPVPVPPPAAAMPPGMPPGMPSGMPAGMPMPMPRARGGRTYRSFKDMDAGALSGKGRLEKTEIQAHKR